MRIALCIPTLGPPSWRLFDSFGQWQAWHYAHHPGQQVSVIRPPRELPIDVARNYLAQQVLEQGHDWLWFTDQDAVYLPETLDRLMVWDKPICGALCMVRSSEEVRPMVYSGRNPEDTAWRVPVDEVYNWLRIHGDVTTNEPQLVDPIPGDALFEASFTGCHCLLIKRRVLEKMRPPWFSGQPGQEDKHFCLKAALLGFGTFVDFSTFVGHAVGSKVIGVRDYMANYLLEMALLEDVE